MLGLRKAERVYRQLASIDDDHTLPERLLDHLEITVRVSERDLGNVPRRGPAVMVANHPFGILDGVVLASLLRRLRPDVKFLANHLLRAFPKVGDLLIPVDPFGGSAAARSNVRGLRQAVDFLAGGGLLVVFPAGEVAHFQWKRRSAADPDWNSGVGRIVSMASRRTEGVVVIPAHIPGANSFAFQALGLIHPRIRTALLVHEVFNKRERDVEVRIGSPIPAGKAECTEYLRWRTDLLASRNQFKPRTALPLRRKSSCLQPVCAPPDQGLLARDIQALSPILSSGEFDVYFASATDIPSVMQEIGRLREVTFRAAGEGTGRSTDIDRFDSHYLQLFVWNREKREVVGAYRLARTDAAAELYTATLFRYGRDFLDRLGPALELGRSFIRVEYQRTMAPLLLLWKGIGAFVARNPQYKVLFGPVSISNQYLSISRHLMVSFLERHAWLGELAGLVVSRNPFRARERHPWVCNDLDDLGTAVADIEPEQRGIPVLLRQYLKLGGRLLGFNVDPQFSDTLDGLIAVDLTRTEPKLLERYLGKPEAAAFLAFHRREQ